MRARYPRLQFELQASDRTIDMVEEGFDVGIRAGPVADASVVVRKLTDIPRIICASPEYLARRGVPSSLESLSTHECIAYRSPSTGRIVKWEFRGDVPESYEPHAVLTLNDIFAVCDAAIAGHGLVQLPTFIATPPIRNGELVPVFVDRESAPAHLVLQYPARPLTPARVRVVVDYLYEKLHDHPDLTFDPRRIVSHKPRARRVISALELRTSRRVSKPECILDRRAVAAAGCNRGTVAENDQILTVQHRTQFAHGTNVDGVRAMNAEEHGRIEPFHQAA